jgi:hypothetical protein
VQSLGALTAADILIQGAQPLLKLEVYMGYFSPFLGWSVYNTFKYGDGTTYGGAWVDLTDLESVGGNYLESVSMSLAGASMSPAPIAASWRARIVNKDAMFHPLHPTSTYNTIFSLGRKVRISTGARIAGVDYYWKQIIGAMNRPRFSGQMFDIDIAGYDYAQVLADTKLKSPDNYWGSSATISTAAGVYTYDLPATCTGAYYAVWNSTPIYNQNDWTHDATVSPHHFVFNADKTIADGTNNLVVYHFTEQVPENIVADILVTAGLYANQASALTNMHYTATGLKIERVWFGAGNSALYSIQQLCERCNYRFYFDYAGTPHFLPAPSAKAAGSEDFTLRHNQFSNFSYYEDDAEAWNRIVITGEEQASPVWQQNAQPNNLRGSASDATSINLIGEKTLDITNHLFQDQTTINSMCSTLLALYKTPKKYFTFSLEFNPLPIEVGDTGALQVRLIPSAGYGDLYHHFAYGDGTVYGAGGTVVTLRGIVRDIKVDQFRQTYKCEEVV